MVVSILLIFRAGKALALQSSSSPQQCLQERRDFLRSTVTSAAAILSVNLFEEHRPNYCAFAATVPISNDSSSLTNFLFNSQFRTVDDVPKEYFTDHRYIYGYVERIIDGDTIRVRHIPGYGLLGVFQSKQKQPLQQRGISQDTLSIRIYGVDCPELAKNTRQTSQPYAEKAKDLTEQLTYHRVVKITFLRKDQYSRAVAVVETTGPLTRVPFLRRWARKDVSVELAKSGLAELYTGGGAEYNDNRAYLESCIEQAQRRRKGIWSLSNRQSAAEKKRELKKENNKDTIRMGTRSATRQTSSTHPLRPVTHQYYNRASGRAGQTETVEVASRSRGGPTTSKNAKSTNGGNKNLLEVAFTGLEFVA